MGSSRQSSRTRGASWDGSGGSAVTPMEIQLIDAVPNVNLILREQLAQLHREAVRFRVAENASGLCDSRA